MLDQYSYRGRHRAPAPTVADQARRAAAIGVLAAAPFSVTAPSADAAVHANWGPIIACESGGKNIHTAIPGPYTASGYYQITNGTWRSNGGTEFAPTAMEATFAEQTIVANRIFAKSGYGPWVQSRPCWLPKMGSTAAPKIVDEPAALVRTISTPRHAAIETVAPVAGFSSPMATGRVSQGQSANHLGIDIAAPKGTPEYAAASGTVVSAGTASGFGLWVRIRTTDGVILTYGHMDTILVHVGQTVTAGQEIATVGNRGNSTGYHLHFQVNTPSGRVMSAVGWLSSHGIAPVGAARHAAATPAAATPVKASDGLPADTGRDRRGLGSYVCDVSHLYFDACDPDNMGQRVQYPLFD